MGRLRSTVRRLREDDGINAVRRRSAMLTDRCWAHAVQRFRPSRSVRCDESIGLAVITVNFSTTRELKLMLLTLSEQVHLDLVQHVIVVDNDSRDGGGAFLRSLSDDASRVHLVERRHWLHHGPALRAGVRELDRLDSAEDHPAGVLLFCDPDVVFLRSDVLEAVAGCFVAHEAALVGEVRPGGRGPDIQASFVAVRRDVYARRDIAPITHDGSPAVRQQRSIVEAGLTVVDLPTNHSGLILHKGRAGVAAAREHRPRNAYATARSHEPHFMGVSDGAATWAAVERRWAGLLEPDGEAELVALLAARFRRLGG